MLRKAAVAAGLSLAFAGASVQAKGFEALLKGDYAFTGEATCLVSPGGFDGDLTPVDGATAPFPRIASFSVQGVRTFNGDGTGSVAARIVTLSHPFALPPNPDTGRPAIYERGGASTVDITSDFTYTVTPDLEVEINTPLLTGKVLTGGRAGQTLEVTQLPVFHGFVSHNLRSITLAHDVAAVEVHKFKNDTGTVLASDSRICHRSRVFLERKGGN